MSGFGDLYLKFLLILAISVFISSLNFMLSRVEHENFFILGPRHLCCKLEEQFDSRLPIYGTLG